MHAFVARVYVAAILGYQDPLLAVAKALTVKPNTAQKIMREVRNVGYDCPPRLAGGKGKMSGKYITCALPSCTNRFYVTLGRPRKFCSHTCSNIAQRGTRTEHGNYVRYGYGCHCSLCCAANTEHCRQSRKKIRERKLK